MIISCTKNAVQSFSYSFSRIYSDNVFSTAIVCDLLPGIENGEISYSGDEALTVGVGNVATYSCNRGYRLIGPEMRTCEDVGAGITGEFSNTEPSCERKSAFVWEWFCIQDKGMTCIGG